MPRHRVPGHASLRRRFTEYLTVDEDFAHPIPDSMTFEAAALCEPLSVGVWAAQKAAIGPGSRVLISGAGPIGIIIAQTARAFGASEIYISDPQEARRAIALRYGATRVIDPDRWEDPAAAIDVDAYIDASGPARAISAGVHAVAPTAMSCWWDLACCSLSFRLPASRFAN